MCASASAVSYTSTVSLQVDDSRTHLGGGGGDGGGGAGGGLGGGLGGGGLGGGCGTTAVLVVSIVYAGKRWQEHAPAGLAVEEKAEVGSVVAAQGTDQLTSAQANASR